MGHLFSAVDRARKLRRSPTNAERMLWQHLRLRQFGQHKFRRQRPIGSYIVDFVCLEKDLIIEVDGDQHDERTEYDEKRTRWLESQGFTVLRFSDHEVLTEIESVREVIWNELEDAPSLILPRNGGEEESIRAFHYRRH